MESPNWQRILDVLHENGGEITCDDINQPWKSSFFAEKEDLTPADAKLGFSQATIAGLITKDTGTSNHGKISLTQKGFDTWRDERCFQRRHAMDKMNLKAQNNFETRQAAIERRQHELDEDFKQSQKEYQYQQSKLNRNLNILTAVLAFSAIIQASTDISQTWSLNPLPVNSHQATYIMLIALATAIILYMAHEKL